MSENIAYIINSAPGIGKTTLLRNLHSKLPGGFALIDGDDVGRITPYENNINWLNVMQDNIADCCDNFKRYGFSRCVIGFVFPAEERLERIKRLLISRGFKIKHIILECDEHEMRVRIERRNTSKLINPDRAAELNNEIKTLSADFRVDTTHIGAETVSDKVIEFITEADE